MNQIRNFGDQRQTASCAYCGGSTETRDHVPSKVFLDEPYPTNLPVVPACGVCNRGFSPDEEYLACLIECTLAGAAEPADVTRAKVKRILERTPALESRLSQARRVDRTGTSFQIESERVRNVVLKLARAHAAFELNEPQMDDPSQIGFTPLALMTAEAREAFETPPRSLIWPEVGSRAMHRLLVSDPRASLWLIVQPGRYRYLAAVGDSVVVRRVIGEYLAYEVLWRG